MKNGVIHANLSSLLHVGVCLQVYSFCDGPFTLFFGS